MTRTKDQRSRQTRPQNSVAWTYPTDSVPADQRTPLNPAAQSFQAPDVTATTHAVFSNDATQTCTTSIVPVYLTSDQDQEVLTYAILDPQSDQSFVTKYTAQRLGLIGEPTSIRLSTLTETSKSIQCRAIGGVRARAFRGGNPVDLPTLYTRLVLPFNRGRIPTSTTVKQWPHLSKIHDCIPDMQACDVGLLLGTNCFRALAPLEVISSSDQTVPYALRTELGWTTVGPAPTLEYSTLSAPASGACGSQQDLGFPMLQTCDVSSLRNSLKSSTPQSSSSGHSMGSVPGRKCVQTLNTGPPSLSSPTHWTTVTALAHRNQLLGAAKAWRFVRDSLRDS